MPLGMERTLLVTDGDTALGAELVRLFAARGCRVVAAAAEAAVGGVSPKASLVVPWNRRSAASARNLLLSALNSVGKVDEALVLSTPRGPEAPLHEQSAAEIEKAFDLSLKPALFVARELVSYFLQNPGGVLGLVSFSTRPADAPAPALERAVREGFKGFASSLMASYAEGGFFLNAFQSFGASPEEFAQFIDKTLEEKARKISGRWFTCQPRGGFIQGMFSAGRRP
jgi:NAD(P)-dependent dehydrogenase (short-subunit alcohol dehydrogenase family)